MTLRSLLSLALLASLAGCDESPPAPEGSGASGAAAGSSAGGASGGAGSAFGGATDAGGVSNGEAGRGGQGGQAGAPALETDCAPGSKSCDERVPRTCDASGTWQSGDECEFACSSGECTGVCVPGGTRCSGATAVEVCDVTGAWQASACVQICSATAGRCACGPGYTGDGETCTPIDYCSPPHGGCSPNATCSQVGATPTCTCDEGSVGDGLACSAPTPRLTEGFDDAAALAGNGWTLQNLSDPVGSSGWFQGNPAAFTAFEGSDDAYLAADASNVSGVNTISNWLVTPTLVFGANASVRFYTRSVASEFPDRIEVRACLAEPCAMPTTATGLGDYTTLLGAVNPTLAVDGYPSTWTQYTFTNATGIPYSGAGRIAIRYWVTDGGTGDNSDYIGVDTLEVTIGAPAYTVGGTVTGLTESGLVLRLNGSVTLPVASDGAFTFDRGLDLGTPYSVSVLTQPAGQTCELADGAGSISADVTDIGVNCVAEP